MASGGGFAEMIFAAVACALSQSCWNLAQDITLLTVTLGSAAVGKIGANSVRYGEQLLFSNIFGAGVGADMMPYNDHLAGRQYCGSSASGAY